MSTLELDNPLELAIDHCGGVTKLAEKLGEKQTTVSMWLSRGNVPSEHWDKFEKATDGSVTDLHFLQYQRFKRKKAA